ncbi:aminomethyl-transferring glycine dehydrogenase subunit GcvPA [bacterium]|nr:aminomethyl-transferring glycine dehydrogenase subunit GcvPA [bacterium]
MQYIPNTDDDRIAMLTAIGVSDFNKLLQPIPENLRLQHPLSLPEGKSEWEVRRHMLTRAHKNHDMTAFTSFLGAGVYDHFIPAAVRALAARSEIYTAYTPYQPEVSQGTLQIIYEFQSMICELFGMDAANASLYDGASALAEAVLLAGSHTRRSKILWPISVHPHYRQVAEAIGKCMGIKTDILATSDGTLGERDLAGKLDSETAAVVFQYPNFFGIIEELESLIEATHKQGALAIVVADPIAMGVLESPGALGADIVVGEGQGLGISPAYGGPGLGLFAAKAPFTRKIPGRIAGVTKDRKGKRGFTLTLQTREQHIRREKATSNICTNQALCAAMATIHLSLIGPNGLREIADTCMAKAHYLASELAKIPGVKIAFASPFFKEFAVRFPLPPAQVVEQLLKKNIFAGVPLAHFRIDMDDLLLVAVTEQRTKEEMDAYVAAINDIV